MKNLSMYSDKEISFCMSEQKTDVHSIDSVFFQRNRKETTFISLQSTYKNKEGFPKYRVVMFKCSQRPHVQLFIYYQIVSVPQGTRKKITCTTEYCISTHDGLGRSTRRLAAEDGNVHRHTLPFAEHTTADLFFYPTQFKRFNATRMRLLLVFGEFQDSSVVFFFYLPVLLLAIWVSNVTVFFYRLLQFGLQFLHRGLK